MKITILAAITMVISLTQACLNQGKPSGHSPSATEIAALDSAPSIHISNHQGEDIYHMVTGTSGGTTYQPWYSTDKQHWQKHGTSFSGNGQLRIISIEDASHADSGQIYVKLVKQ